MSQRTKARAFGRTRDERAALLKSLIRSLILEERISTTEAKAKEIRPMVEKLVTRARTDTVANRRLILSRVGDPTAVQKLFKALAPRFKGVPGGYLRIVKRAPRADGRRTAYIAFTK
ncbi:MAG: 50S ribosomal protein L17 [Minisyncoccia bacterium]